MRTEILACDFLGLRLPSPLVLASGIIGTSPSLLVRAARSGAVSSLPRAVAWYPGPATPTQSPWISAAA